MMGIGPQEEQGRAVVVFPVSFGATLYSPLAKIAGENFRDGSGCRMLRLSKWG